MNNAENSIRVVTAAKAIRLRPGVYMENADQMGLEFLIAELLLSLKFINEYGRLVCILNGNEISLKLEGIYTEAYKNYFHPEKKKEQKVWRNCAFINSDLLVFVLACLSEKSYLMIEDENEKLQINGEKSKFSYKYGEVSYPHTPNHSLEIRFTPDPEIFKELNLRFDYLLHFMWNQSYLNPQLSIEVNNGSERVVFSNRKGMADLADLLLHNSGYYPECRLDRKLELRDYHLDISLAFLPHYGNQIIKLWANGNNQSGGSLEHGLLNGIEDYYKHKEKKRNSCKILLCAHIRSDFLAYGGSLKNSLDMPELEKTLREYIFNELIATS